MIRSWVRTFRRKMLRSESTVKRVAIAATVLGLLLTLAGPLVPQAQAVTTNAARVSFTFDDGFQSAYTLAAPTLAKYGFAGTSYVTTNCIGMVVVPNTCRADSRVAYMDWSQVADLAATYQWEIGSHTSSHPLLVSTDPEDQPTALTPAQVVAELADSKIAIKNNTGIDAQAFADPYGDWNQTSLAQIAKLYSSHRGFADIGPNGFPYNDYLLYNQPVQAGTRGVTSVSVNTVKNLIDTAKTQNQWLVLTFHDIVASGAAEYSYNLADLDAIAAYVKSQNIPVVTVSDGLVSGTNLLPNGTFDTPLSADVANTTVWSTSDPVNIRQDTNGNGSFPSATNSVHLNGTTKNIELFSPRVAVLPTETYIIKTFLNVQEITVGAGHEVAFFIDEYDANGNYLSTQYKKSEVSRWLANMNFNYIPSTSDVRAARLQIVVTANSGISAYVDNVQWIISGSVTGGQGGGTKAGDINGDTVVNVLDLSVMVSNWQRTPATRSQGDLNGDGVVNVLDLSVLASNWSR